MTQASSQDGSSRCSDVGVGRGTRDPGTASQPRTTEDSRTEDVGHRQSDSAASDGYSAASITDFGTNIGADFGVIFGADFCTNSDSSQTAAARGRGTGTTPGAPARGTSTPTDSAMSAPTSAPQPAPGTSTPDMPSHRPDSDSGHVVSPPPQAARRTTRQQPRDPQAGGGGSRKLEAPRELTPRAASPLSPPGPEKHERGPGMTTRHLRTDSGCDSGLSVRPGVTR